MTLRPFDTISSSIALKPLGFPIHDREVGFAYKENANPSPSLQNFIDFYQTYKPEVHA